MEKVNVTVRLEKESIDFLDLLGKSLDRDRSYLIKQAVQNYIALHRWQVEEVKQALAEADAGDFVPEEEMERLCAKWTR